ncbi:hypothetical protein [Amycolatopsis taiwanensis]|nr:hypothetical protein [Amycolatopsis taiwanensis]
MVRTPGPPAGAERQAERPRLPDLVDKHRNDRTNDDNDDGPAGTLVPVR